MESRAYTEDELKKFLKEVNRTPISEIQALFLQHKSLPNTIKTLLSFAPENTLVIICHTLFTHDIKELNKDILKKAPRWISLNLELSESSPLAKSMNAILAAIRYGADDSLAKTYRLDFPEECYLNLSGAHLHSMNSKNKNFSWANLAATDFARAYLDNADFSHANLHHTILRESPLSHANFQEANVSFVDFTRSTLTNANFINANLTGTNFSEATLTNAHFFDADMIVNKNSLQQALDRLHTMLDNHPQLSLLRTAIANDLRSLINALSANKRAEAYNTAYQHPLLMQHRELSGIRAFINKTHGLFASKSDDGKVARSPIETHGQTVLAKTGNK